MLSPQRAMVDPMGWFHYSEAYAKGIYQAAQHPGTILKKLVDWEDWTNGHPGRAIGKLLPMAVITVATAGGGAAADAGVAGGEAAAEATAVTAGEATTEVVGTTVTREVAEASTVQAGAGAEGGLAGTETGAGGLSTGPPPRIELGEIKPIASYRQGLYQLNGRGAAGNDALVTFDNQGTVHMQVFGEDATATKRIIWEDDIGQVSPLPTAKPGTTQFGDQMEPLVRDMVQKSTGQEFQFKLPNAGGPDLVPSK